MAIIIIPIILFAIGFGLIALSVRLDGQRERGWPIAYGKIRKADLEETSARRGMNYEVEVVYTYEVNGQKYEGHSLGIDYEGSADETAEIALARKLRESASWPVRYGPDDPSRSFLDYQSDDDDWPITAGKVQEATVDKYKIDEDVSYAVHVEYTYEVDRKDYEGNYVAFNYYGSSDRATEEALRDKLLGAGRVGVRYDPDDPQVSCLSWHDEPTPRILFYVGLFWVLATTGIVAVEWLRMLGDPVLVESLIVK